MVKNFKASVVNKPNLFILGAPKCGTTALASNMAQHTQIYLPGQKEPRYFDRAIFYDKEEDYFTKTLEEYLFYYEDAQDQKYLLDGSVFNMYDKKSIDAILELSPDAKCIVILRDPVEASISMFYQRLSYVDVSMREVCEDFNKCWDMLAERKEDRGYPKGCKNKFLFRYDLLYSYQKYIPYLQERLGKNLFIGFYDEYKNNPDLFFKKLFDFLDLESIDIENKQCNTSAIVQKSLLLDTLHFIAKNTLPLRKKLGLVGVVNMQKNIVKNYKVPIDKTIQVKEDVYGFFQPTYLFMDNLRC